MQTINELFGQGFNLNILQMTLRAIVIFFIALILIRYTGMRMFGIKSAFDICVTIYACAGVPTPNLIKHSDL